MRNRLLYILCAGAFLFSACEKSIVTEVINPDYTDPFPQGEAIAVDASLSTVRATRAVGKTFDAGDVLYAYVEAGKKDGEPATFKPVVEEGSLSGDAAALYSKLLKFTLKNDNTNNNQPTTDANVTTSKSFNETYYWDDFSTMTYDLRNTNPQRGIRLKYGYCYNGGTPTSGLDSDDKKKEGKIDWAVESDQNTKGTKTSDLLMAKTQDMITYTHDPNDGRGSLVLPYTHAMSKFTIEIQCGNTFADSATALENTEISLNHMQAKCTVDAPNGTVTPTDKNVDGAILESLPMHAETSENQDIKTFTAIVAPTNLSIGNILADISEVAGVPYSIYITPGLLGDKNQAGYWASKLTEVNEENIQDGVAQAKPRTRADETKTITKGKGYMTQPGVNYKLVVTVEKQAISVSASIADWNEVGASAYGVINFSHDITDKNGTIDVGNYDYFDIYRAEYYERNPPTNGSFDSDATTNGINPATKYSVDTETYYPVIYWNDGSTKYYFRALSGGVSSDTNSADITIKNGNTNNNDVIWGTTEAHSGTDADGHAYNYAEGAAIAPRTGQVPLTFKHLLTKVSFNLKTSDDDAKAVNLDGAKIQISSIKNECRLDLQTGVTTENGNAGYLYNDNSDTKGRLTIYNSTNKNATLSNQIVTPQTITDASYLIITLADGTVYKLQLNQCLVTDTNGDPTETKISTWAQGTHYTYTIHIEKEAITFRALIKDWVESKGSGNATLDWD